MSLPLKYSALVSSLYLLCTIVLILSCVEDLIVPEAPVDTSDLFVPCNRTISEALDAYSDTTWTAQGIKDFIQGTWRFHAIQTLQSDTLIPVNMEFETELRFSDSIFEAYEPFDVFRGAGEYLIEPTSPESGLFRIKVITNELAIGGFVSGRVIPCNSDLIINKSFIDRGDRYYRKVE